MKKTKNVEDPIIIIGMGRSGTTLLSKLLENFGVFMGAKKEKNNESIFFLKFNEYIFKAGNATWDNPVNMTYTNDLFIENIKKIFAKRAKSLFAINYLGIKKIFKFQGLKNINFPWGWKDPRNSFTLKIWKQIYPNAKVIHIHRNPVDVANSLKKRSLAQEKSVKISLKKFVAQYFLKSYFFHDSYRVQSIKEGYKLWTEYIKECLSYDDVFHISYEELLKNPEYELDKLLKFINLNIDRNEIQKISKMIKRDRCYAFLTNNDLLDFYHKIKDDEFIKKLNYHNLSNE